MRLFKEFTFEGAHYLPAAELGQENARVHGHSFRVRIVIEGEPSRETGLVVPFGVLEEEMESVRRRLDHQLLNEVEGLELPTLECLARWIWDQLKGALPGLVEVGVFRDTCGEGCLYSGSQGMP